MYLGTIFPNKTLNPSVGDVLNDLQFFFPIKCISAFLLNFKEGSYVFLAQKGTICYLTYYLFFSSFYSFSCFLLSCTKIFFLNYNSYCSVVSTTGAYSLVLMGCKLIYKIYPWILRICRITVLAPTAVHLLLQL